MFLDQFLFELSCKSTKTNTQRNTDYDEYSIIAKCNYNNPHQVTCPHQVRCPHMVTREGVLRKT